MAHGATATPGQARGPSHVGYNEEAVVAFYQQLLNLRDVVLTDTHPRFKLSAVAKDRLRAAAAPAPTANGTTSRAVHPHGSGPSNDAAFMSNGVRSAQAMMTRPPTLQPSSSSIDPVLLTKSDDLVRAEMQLKRQRIEREIKDAWDQRKHSARDKDHEPAPLTMLSEILQRALELVIPVSGLKLAAAATEAATDSFDDNSYYSSQVGDWFSEKSTAASIQSLAEINGTVESAPQVSGARTQMEATTLPGLASTVSLPSEVNIPVQRLDKQPNTRSKAPHPTTVHSSLADAANSEASYDLGGADSDYTPPEADAFNDGDVDDETMNLDDDEDDDDSEYTPRTEMSPAREEPRPQVAIVSNRLTHIAAPQPERVSPLAVPKPPGLQSSLFAVHPANQGPRAAKTQFQDPAITHPQVGFQSETSDNSPRNSGQQTPAAPMTKNQKRARNKKRKRDDIVNLQRSGREARRRRVAPASPEPYIKGEPTSPPPFAGIPALPPPPTQSRGPYQLPPDVEMLSPADLRSRDLYHRQSSRVQPYALSHATPPVAVQATSPATSVRRPRRDDQNLRRVASLHAAHRPHASQEAPVYSPNGLYGAASLHNPERQTIYTPHYQEPGRYPRSERSMSPPQLGQYREPQVQRIASPAMMAPPPPPSPGRRMVIDQYGNKYYAAESEQPPPIRMSVAPQARVEPNVVYQRAPSRASTVYAPRSTQSVYEVAGLGSMPPPAVRRVFTQPTPSAVEYPQYRQREYSVRPTEPQYYRDEPAPVYMQEASQAPRRPGTAYAEEYSPSQPQVLRAYSTRPEIEAPPRYASRQASMAPQIQYLQQPDVLPHGVRAVSVMPGNGHEYPPLHQEVRYAYPAQTSQHVRYVEDHGMRGHVEPARDAYGRVLRSLDGYP